MSSRLINHMNNKPFGAFLFLYSHNGNLTPSHMVFVYFSCCNLRGDYQECSFGGNDMESCLDMLSLLVRGG